MRRGVLSRLGAVVGRLHQPPVPRAPGLPPRVHQRPRVLLPPRDPGYGPYRPGGLVPACFCGREWPGTPRGWAAYEAHVEADTEACERERARRMRERARLRERQRQEAIAADPELTRQQRAYDAETRQRTRQRGQLAAS